MRWRAASDSLKPRHFEIKEDTAVGFYLYVFEGNKCVYDYLQDTLEIAIDCAWEDFKVPKSLWKKIDSEPRKEW